MNRARERCCDCAQTESRCSDGSCPCVALRKVCEEQCESTRYRCDCLNQVVSKCNCPLPNDYITFPSPAVNSNSKACRICINANQCDCARLKEACTKLCACKQLCINKEVKRTAPVSKPTASCNCAKSKKQCSKRDCNCRSLFEFCSSRCKCQGDCVNGPSKFSISRHTQHCFLEHKAEISAAVLTLLGEDYVYRVELSHDGKSEKHCEEKALAILEELVGKYSVSLREVVIYLSRSPCFHQDCEPRCDVIDECKSNKACSKLLALLICKLRKRLNRADVKLTVKFLFPHLNRGDLYTKQGILCLLQHGIKVEPLLMKEWSVIMDWYPHSEHKGDYLSLWNSHNLDQAVVKSQSFVNECRRALAMPLKFWVAEIHEIVRNAILQYSEIRGKLQYFGEALKCLDLTATPHKIRSTPIKRRSFIDILELRDKLHLRDLHGAHHQSKADKDQKQSSDSSLQPEDNGVAQQMVASICGRSFDDCETNEIAQRIRRATGNIAVEIDGLLDYLMMKSNL